MIAWLLKLAGVTLAVGAIGTAGMAWSALDILHARVDLPGGDTTFEVPRGTNFGKMAQAMVDAGLLADADALALYARLTGRSAKIKAGEYAVRDGDTPVRVLERIIAGTSVQYAITLVEGWTFKQIRAALGRTSPLVPTLRDSSDDEVMARLGKPGTHPEGWFFPDTYHYARGQSDLDILRRAHQAMEARLAAAWESRAPDLPYATPYEALIMASIVERESGVAHERPQVAGVFVRRLKRGMKLQTDPTVIYGMGDRYDGNIRRRDLREDTPYNTYVHKGLTPTPIANPGASAIDAALHPAPGTALYFVARGDGSGEHAFSDNYEQHRKAVAAYLKTRANRRTGS